VQLPEIGFGTWQYAGGIEPLRRAIDLGACFIDTAESYGIENLVGEAIRGIRGDVFVATKVRPRHFRRPDLLSAADRSLERLRTDYIDLYQLHWPNDTVPIEETMSAMEELVARGKVRFIGVSNFSASELRKAQAALSNCRIASNQVRYSLVDRSIEVDLLAYCQRNNVTVIAYSPLARGLHYIRMSDPSDILGRISAQARRTPAQVALNWCIAKEAVVAIPKSNRVDRVAENCNASDWRLSPEQLELLDREIKFHKRGRVKPALRRLARHLLQSFGYRL
jgi:diketogulonate reductase-like aldo/keto reductase